MPERYKPRAAPVLQQRRATLQGLAERWGITRSRTGQLAADPTFPPGEPVLGGPVVYEIAACDAWRAADPETRRIKAEFAARRREGGTPGWWNVWP